MINKTSGFGRAAVICGAGALFAAGVGCSTDTVGEPSSYATFEQAYEAASKVLLDAGIDPADYGVVLKRCDSPPSEENRPVTDDVGPEWAEALGNCADVARYFGGGSAKQTLLSYIEGNIREWDVIPESEKDAYVQIYTERANRKSRYAR